MPSSRSNITSLTADYDAIERAIRETSRGRWFLSCYLERNRSAETKTLLSAIGKLENAMRDSGQTLQETGTTFDTLMTLRNTIDQAREDMAHLPRVDEVATELPLPRFSFETAPAAMADDILTIRDAAAGIHSAAYALQAAGVFQGVARQITERASTIDRACASQEAMLARTARMASLISEIEAEVLNAFEDDQQLPYNFYEHDAEIRSFPTRALRDRTIPNVVVEEISAALSDYDLDDEDSYPPNSA